MQDRYSFISEIKTLGIENLYNIFDAFRECIFVTSIDDENTILYINKAGIELLKKYEDDIEKVYGYNIDTNSIIGMSVHKFHKNPKNVRNLLKSLKPGEVLKNADIEIGNMVIESYRMGVFDDNENPIYYIAIWQDITDKLRLAENAKSQSRLKRFSILLAEIINAIQNSNNENELLDKVCKQTIKHTYTKLAWIGKPDEIGRFEILSSAGDIGYLSNMFISINQSLPESKNPVSKAYIEQKPQYFTFHDDNLPPICQEKSKKYGFHIGAALPIFRNGNIWGVYAIYKGFNDPFDEESQKLLEDISKNIGSGLDKIDIIKRKEELENFTRLLVNNLTTGILVVRYPDRIIEYANDKALELFGAKSKEELIGKSTKELVVNDEEFLILGKVAKEAIDNGFTKRKDIPYKRLDGSIIHVDLSGQKLPSKEEYMDRIMWVFVDVEDRYKFETELYKQATTDLLTDIPNRRYFDLKLQEAIMSAKLNNRSLSIFVIDLDDFKLINDTYGIEIADEILKTVAKRLRSVIRDIDFIARLTDDEFGICVQGIGKEAIETILERIISAIKSPIDISGHTINLDASIGVAIYDPLKDDINEVDLIRMAYRPLYELKMHKKDRLNPWATYGECLKLKLSRSQILLYKGLVEIFYQPILDINQNKIVGVEALSRLKDEKGKIISPAIFLNELNKKDIEELTYIVLEKAIKDIKSIDQELGTRLWVSVNIDIDTLSESFILNIQQKMSNFQIEKNRLAFEILETSEFGEKDKLIEYIKAFKQMGISMALDDVGSAYSSLLRIKELPVDKIKLDQSFVRTLNKRPKELMFVQSINYLAYGLGVELVVEGVETEHIMDALLVLGVPMLQGYHIAKPMPIESLKDFLRDKYRFLKDYTYPNSILGVYAQSSSYHDHIKKLIESNIQIISPNIISEYNLCPTHKSLCRIISCQDQHINEAHKKYHEELGKCLTKFLEQAKPIDWGYIKNLHNEFTDKLLDLIK